MPINKRLRITTIGVSPYNKLFLAGVIKGVGERFFQVALLSIMASTANSGFAIGAVLALRVLPFLLLAPFSGWLLAHVSHVRMLKSIDFARSVLALLPLFAQDGHLIGLLIAAQVMLSCGEAMYAPARRAVIPLMVKQDELGRVNSLEQVMTGVILIVGSVTGGVVSYLFGTNTAFIIQCIAFVCSGWLVSSIRLSEQISVQAKDKKVEVEYPKPGKRSVYFLVKCSAPLQMLIIYELMITFPGGIENVMISMYAAEVYGMGNLGVGILYGALGLGLFMSYFVSQHIRNSLFGLAILTLALESAMLIWLSYTSYFALAVLICVLQSFFAGITNALMDTKLMQETPIQHQGILFGWLAALSNTLFGMSMFIAGYLTAYIELRALGRWGGILYAIIAAVLWLYLMIRVRKHNFNNRTI
ncbi:MFS transporter [Neobacillus mesonae]|nr:MFS transporter [Neobacillus mesonae]